MSDQPINVAICIPSGDDVKAEFAVSLSEMVRITTAKYDGGGIHFTTAVLNYRTSNLPHSRSLLAGVAVERGFDYVLFMDADMRFPPATLGRLLVVATINDLPIVACTASTRKQGAMSRTNAINGGRRIDPIRTEGIQEVERVGTGIMLIKAAVFRQLPQPWFMFAWDEKDQIFGGEDHYFCDKARAHGFKVCVDFEMSKHIGHVGSFVYTLDEAADIASVCSREEAYCLPPNVKNMLNPPHLLPDDEVKA